MATAISQAGELFTLSQLGIVSINVEKTDASITQEDGNVITAVGSFTYTKADGTTSSIGTSVAVDVDLIQDTFASQFVDAVDVLPEAAALPSVDGAGQVRSLHEAASLSPELLDALTACAA